MTTNRNVQATLQWFIDQASVSTVQAANTQVLASTKAVADETITAAGTLKKAVDSEVLDYKALADAAEAAQKQSESLNETLSHSNSKTPTQTQSANTPVSGLLGRLGDEAQAIGFMRELEQIQTREAAQTAQQVSTEAAVTGQLAAQTAEVEDQLYLSQRLAEATAVRESAERGVLADLRAEIEAGQQVAANTNVSDAGGVGGIAASKVAGRIAGIGSIVGSSAGGEGFRDVAQIVQLGAIFGPLGAGAGIAAVALKKATDAEAERTKAAEDFVNKVEGTAGKTTEALNQQIEAEKQRNQTLTGSKEVLEGFRERVIAQQQAFNQGFSSADEYQTNIRTINTELAAASGGTVKLSDNLSDMAGNVSGLDSAVSKAQSEIDDSNGTIAFLGVQVGTLATQANDAAEALHKAALEQEAGADKALEIDRLTKEQRDERIAQDKRDIDVLTRLVGAGNLNEEALKNVAGRIDTLNGDLAVLTPLTDTYADQLKREADEKERITTATDNYLQSVTDDIQTREAVIKAQQDISTATIEHADKLKEIAANEQEQESQDRQKAAEQAEDQTREHLDRVQDIEDQYALDHEAAVGNRDALANYKAKQAADTQLSKEDRKFGEQEDQLEKHLDQQLRDEQTAQRKAEQSENASYAKQYQQLVTSLNNAQVAESRQQGLMAAYQAQANQNRLVAEVNHQNYMLGAAAQGYKLAEAAYQNHLNSLAQIAGGAFIGPRPGYSVGNTTSLIGNPVFNQAIDSRVVQIMKAANR